MFVAVKKILANSWVRFLGGVLNVALALFFIVQTLLLTGMLTGFDVEVPQGICEKFENILSEQGIKFRAESITIDMQGRLDFKNLSVGLTGIERNIFEARSAHIGFDMFELLLGNPVFKSFDLRGGKAYPIYAADDSKLLCDCLEISISRRGAFYKLENSNANVGKLCVILNGEIPVKFLANLTNSKVDSARDSAQAEAPELSAKIMKFWDEASKKAFELQGYLSGLEKPVIIAEFEVDKKSAIRARARAFVESVKIAVKDELISVKNARAFASYNSAQSPESLMVSAVSGEVNAYGASAKNSAISGVLNFKKASLSSTRALLINAEYKSVRAKYLGVYKNNLAQDDYVDDWAINAKIGSGVILAKTNGSLKNFKVVFESELDCAELLKCSLIPQIPELKMFAFKKPIMLSGSGLFDLEGEFDCNIKANFLIDDALFFGVETKSVQGGLTYNFANGKFWAKDVQVVSPEGWQIGGDVYQNLKDYEYRFLLTGSLRPMAIAHFMEPWWTDVFSDFKFSKGHFPRADISVAGQWGAPEYIYVYGNVVADGGIRNGVEFEKASLDIWVNPSHIAILNLYAANENRTLTGALDWTYPEHKLTRYDINKVFAKSTLNKRELIAMGGERVKDVVKILDFYNAPQISLKLFMPNPATHKNPKDTANLDYFAEGLTKAGKFNLQNLKFKAFANGDDIEIRGATFNFGGGEGSGNIDLSKVDAKDCFRADIKLKNANQYDFVETLQSLGETPQEDKNSDVKSVVKSDVKSVAKSDGKKDNSLDESYKKGLVSGTVKIEGFTDDAKSIKARGKAQLVNKDLAEIHILGAISRTASAMSIPLGSFDMTSASSDFEISDGVASFPTLKIEGDTAIITGQARYNFIDDDITAKAIFAPFAAVKIPVFSQIMAIADPILSVVQISLNGKFDDPQVSLSLKPFNMFKNETRILQDMGKRIDSDIEKRLVPVQ